MLLSDQPSFLLAGDETANLKFRHIASLKMALQCVALVSKETGWADLFGRRDPFYLSAAPLFTELQLQRARAAVRSWLWAPLLHSCMHSVATVWISIITLLWSFIVQSGINRGSLRNLTHCRVQDIGGACLGTGLSGSLADVKLILKFQRRLLLR